MSASQAQSLLIDIQSYIPEIRGWLVNTAKNKLISADTYLHSLQCDFSYMFN